MPNPKGEMKAVTTRSGLAYEGPLIPTNSPLEKVVEQDTKETTDKEHSNYQGSTAYIQPPAVPISILEPDVRRTQPKHTIPYPSRLNEQKLQEITLMVNDEFVTFNLNQTMRYSSTYDDNSVNQVDVIDIACEEFVQDVLDFQYNSKNRKPTLVSNPSFSKKTENVFCKEPVVKSSSATLTPFGESYFFLEEIEDFLNNESIPTGIENSLYDPDGDILYLEKLLNDDPFQLPPMDLNQAEETKAKSSIE
nr:reverse transcriptase domain-containing protein [Tanacetum cinerariifolium]